MSQSPCWISACAGLVTLTAACVHVPDSIKQEFRAAEPDEHSNYQPALHGKAPPADASDPWSRWAANQSWATDAGTSPDAGPAVAPELERSLPTMPTAPTAPSGPPVVAPAVSVDGGAP